MNKVFFTPGPTELYPEVRSYIEKALDENICSINHRSREFMEIYRSVSLNLRQLMNIPGNYHIFFLSSATECMDRIIQNCVEKRSYHFVNGAFSERFYKTAVELNKDAVKYSVGYGSGFDFSEIKITNDPELICFTQNETSTGVAVDPLEIYKIRDLYPDSLIAVDIVTSSPFINLDYNRIDCAFFSVQKGFGLPAGLGVLIVNDKCLNKAEYLKSKNVSIGSYHNFISLLENEVKFQTTETPNVLGIYLLGKVSESLNKYGVDKMREETIIKSEILYDYFDKHSFLKPLVQNKPDRSKTIIEIDTGDKQIEIKRKLADSGIIVGSGYGKLKDTHIRIANFPMHKLSDIKRIINILSAD